MLPDNLIVKPTLGTINKWSKVTFLVENLKIPNKYDDVQIIISSITKDYTLWRMTTNGKLSKINNKTYITLKLNNNLEHGLYIINQLTFQNSSNPQDQLIIKEKDYLFYPFEIAKISDDKHTPHELMLQHMKIIRDRENEFKSGISYNSNDSMNEYTVFIFIKDCLITTPMRFGFYGLKRYEDLEFKDEIKMVDKYFRGKGFQLNDINEILDRAKKGQPTIIAQFPNIEAPSMEIAKDIAKFHSELTINLLSLHRDGPGSIFASLVVDKLTSETDFEPNIPLYHGNLIGGFISGENLPELKAHIEKSLENKLIQLYLAFYKEALIEKTYEFSYLRYWNLLEIITRNTLKKDEYLRDYNGNVKLHHNTNQPLKVKDSNTFQLVFELLRRVNRPIKSSIDENIIEISIKVWNRRRNCIAHYGSCFADDPDICQITHPKDHVRETYIICKTARDEMITKYGNPNNDDYLTSLKNYTKNVIISLLNNVLN